MAVEDVIDLLTAYIDRVKDPTETGDQVGDPILQDLRTFLRQQFHDYTGYISLWDEYEANPIQMQDELIGAIEAVEEGDPNIGLRMDAYFAEYNRTVNTPISEEIEAADPNSSAETSDSPGEMATVDDTVDDYYSGTYIYGEVERGTETESQEIGLSKDPLDEVQEIPITGAEITEMPGLFFRLYQSVRDRPDLSDEQRTRAIAILEDIEERIQANEGEIEGEREPLQGLIFELESTAPDIAAALLEDDEFTHFMDGDRYLNS
jgi:hypothetical protein